MNQTTNKRFSKFKRANITAQAALASYQGMKDSAENSRVDENDDRNAELLG